MSVSDTIRAEIIAGLKEIEHKKGIHILYACESGSRAWGFPSPDSDYDVRFIYSFDRDKYLSIAEPEENINLAIHNDLDICGWELRKTLRLLRKSNAAVLEHMQSPITYIEKANFNDTFKELAAKYYAPRACIHHYLGLANNAFTSVKDASEIKLKKYFYIIRSLLAAMWAADRQGIPPMEYDRLLVQINDNKEICTILANLRERKMQSLESGTTPSLPLLNEFIATELQRCDEAAKTIERSITDHRLLDEFFREIISQ